MLYVVECAYTDPQSEAAWNTFYNQEKLPALVSVPGFYASQRFRALSEGCPCYLALHDIHDATIIDSDAYRRNGGSLTKTAAELQVSKQNLAYKMKKYNIR